MKNKETFNTVEIKRRNESKEAEVMSVNFINDNLLL